MRFEQINEISSEDVGKMLTDYPEAMESLLLTFNQLIQNINRFSTTVSLEDNVDCQIRQFNWKGDTVELGLNSKKNPRQIVVGRVVALDASDIDEAVQITDWVVNKFRNLQIRNVSGVTVDVEYNITITIYY